ncbi:winged helix-turn-helix domain-containing protein [Serratia marcescens]|uniref:winged helix-turn-helix domain-containing protein n=1 Tax=Serratia marcescens TaxID=615 RepID=UPI003EDFDC9D
MMYLINGVAKYNSLDGTLFCHDNLVDIITLNRVTSELLLLFLQNNGMALSRDSMLNALWLSKGLSASSNSLNNYVSMLRKALSQCGLPNLIKTIPKYGFIFEADSVFLLDEDPKEGGDLYSEPAMNPSAWLFFLPATGDGANRGLSGMVKVMTFVLLLVFISLITYYSYRFKNINTPVLVTAQCQFYLVGDEAKGLGENVALDAIHTFMQREKLDCTHQANVYFFVDRLVDSKGKPFVNHLLVYCPLDNKLPCENYYLFDYE